MHCFNKQKDSIDTTIKMNRKKPPFSRLKISLYIVVKTPKVEISKGMKITVRPRLVEKSQQQFR